jgi:GntR family transcriptional regulator
VYQAKNAREAARGSSIRYGTHGPRRIRSTMTEVLERSAPGAARATFSPLYLQIKSLITNGLQSGEWKPGEAIPSESDLARRYGVSQGTVRKAIDAMAAENLVLRRQGKGTFVATHHEPRAQFRFLRLAPDDERDEPSESRVIDCRRLRAPADIARRLDLRAGDGVVVIRRVLTFDGVPTVLDNIWLNGVVFRGLTAERIAAYRGPLYGQFESEFATPMTRADEKIRAVPADAAAARMLEVAVGTPLLSVERVSMTYGARPVELRLGLYLTTRHHYRNTLG